MAEFADFGLNLSHTVRRIVTEASAAPLRALRVFVVRPWPPAHPGSIGQTLALEQRCVEVAV